MSVGQTDGFDRAGGDADAVEIAGGVIDNGDTTFEGDGIDWTSFDAKAATGAFFRIDEDFHGHLRE